MRSINVAALNYKRYYFTISAQPVLGQKYLLRPDSDLETKVSKLIKIHYYEGGGVTYDTYPTIILGGVLYNTIQRQDLRKILITLLNHKKELFLNMCPANVFRSGIASFQPPNIIPLGVQIEELTFINTKILTDQSWLTFVGTLSTTFPVIIPFSFGYSDK